MKVLVTGGAGYLGAVLSLSLIEQGHQVRVLDNLKYGGRSLLALFGHPRLDLMVGDVRDRSAVERAVEQVDAVVHLAAIVGDPACARDPEAARASNERASLQLIRSADTAGVSRFVFASTCSNYGKMSDQSKYVDEESELSPVSLYAETKVAVEKALLQSSDPSLKWCPTPLRFATVFGVSTRMRFDLTVNEFTMEMLTKKHLVVFGEQFWRPYIHVRDAARGIKLVLESAASKVAGRVFNVGSTDQNFQKQQLVDMIRPHVPDAVIEFVHKTEDQRDYRVSFARIADQLDFKITRTVAEGIQEVSALVRNNIISDFTEKRFRN